MTATNEKPAPIATIDQVGLPTAAQIETKTANQIASTVGDHLVVAYRDLTALSAVTNQTRVEIVEIAAAVGRVVTNPSVVLTTVLSPPTAAVVGGQIVVIGALLATAEVALEATAVIATAAITVYQAADTAREVAAIQATGLGELTVMGIQTAIGRELFPAETIIFVGLLLGELVNQGIGFEFSLLDPAYRAKLSQPGGADTLRADLSSRLRVALKNAVGTFGPLFDSYIRDTLAAFRCYGIVDGPLHVYGANVTDSFLGTEESAHRTAAYLAKLQEQDASLRAHIAQNADGDYVPRDAAGLLVIDGLTDDTGGSDLTIVKVVTYDGPPPMFVVSLPSTANWAVSGSRNANDLIGNFAAFTPGGSMLQAAARDALDRAVAAYRSKHPAIDVSRPDVVLTGFSQGGIGAAYVTEQLRDRANVLAAVTAGAPVNRAETGTVPITNFADDQDVVPAFDGNVRRANVTSITDDNGGNTPFDAHDVIRYASVAERHPDALPATVVARMQDAKTSVDDYVYQQ